MKRWTSKAVVMAAFVLGAGSAAAQQCVGFGDVLATDSICPSVEWIRNRGVTLGCTATTYCPTDVVTRGSMALFMQRLGKALSSEVHKDHVTEFNATIPGESPTPPLLLCAMAGDSTVKPYPRQALLNASVAGLANGSSVAWRAFWIYSIDGGTTFQPISDGANFISTPRASSGPNQWSGVALSFALDLPASTPLQVRVVVRRDNILTGTTGNFADARCQMTVNIVNANGTTSPL